MNKNENRYSLPLFVTQEVKMKQYQKKLLLIIAILSLVLASFSVSFAVPRESFGGDVTIQGVSRVSISTDRATSTTVKVKASGPVTAVADSITTKATLYVYNPSTGALTSSGVTPVTQTDYNCTSYSFSTTFALNATKSYKVKLEIQDITNGKKTTRTEYSNSF